MGHKARQISERALPDTDMLKLMESRAVSELGIILNPDTLAAAGMSNSIAEKEAFAWLSNHIDQVGDKQPNRKNEIHLEYRPKREIYEEYATFARDVMFSKEITYPSFIKMWNRCFMNVKIRKYKAVEGKCATCALLTQLRSTARTAAERQKCTELHFWHR